MADANLQTDLDALREQRDAALLRLELKQLEAAAGMPLTEAWGDLVDMRDYLRDDPTFQMGGASRPIYATSIDDRRDGRFRPVYETEGDLAAIRASARNLVLLTGVRTAALDSLANYTLGSGFTFKASPESETERMSHVLAAAVQTVIDRFLDENDFCGVIDREAHARSREDGECLIAFDNEEIRQGRVVLHFIEPDQLCEPENAAQLEEWIDSEYPECSIPGPSCWRFGVHTREGRTWQTLGYHIVRDGRGADWDYYPASRIEHIKRNVTRNAKRGVSDFLEVLNDLQREAKLCGNMTQGAALQAAIAWILQGAPGQTQGQLAGMGGADRANLPRPSVFGSSGQSSTMNAAHYPAGTILKVGAAQQYLPGPMGAERNAGFELVGQYALRRIGIRWNMPEYMISGDASNGNYASSLVAEAPFVKAREADQQFYRLHFLSLMWKAVRLYVESGRFARYGLHEDQYGDLMRLVRIDCECPTVASRDPKMAVDADKVLVDGGIMSKQTWAGRNGLDYEQEQKLGALEKPPEPSPFAFGSGPAMPAAPQEEPDEAPVRESTLSAAVSAALESVATTEEARAILDHFREGRR